MKHTEEVNRKEFFSLGDRENKAAVTAEGVSQDSLKQVFISFIFKMT